MDEISKSIAATIRSKEYFKDAMRWYEYKYIYPITQRSLLLILAGITSFGLIIILYNIISLLPVKRELPFPIMTENTIDYYSRIKKLSKSHITSQTDLANYLLTKYVNEREAYSYKSISKQMKFIKHNSSKQVYRKFYNSLNITNPSSPVLLFQNRINREIKILSISYVESELDEGISNAIIKFKGKLSTTYNSDSQESIWLAKITFELSDIEKVVKENNSFYFVVTDYDVQQIE
jgi:type IV secretion system protein VirB8